MTKSQFPKVQMHRIRFTNLTADRVKAALVSTQSGPASASPLASDLAGTSMRIVTDGGPVLNYEFASGSRLTLREESGAPAAAGYGALHLHHMTLFSHMIPGTTRGYTVVIDRNTKRVTVFEIWFGGEIWWNGFGDKVQTLDIPREAQREVYFGYVVEKGRPAPEGRMGHTNRAEGRGYHWTQDNGVETLDMYPSTLYSNIVELTRFGNETAYCAPSDYIRVDDKVYIYQRTECEFSGAMTIYLFDSNRMEQIGMRLGFDADDRLEYYLFRGKGQWLGQLAQYEPFGVTKVVPVAPGPKGEKPPKGARRVFRPARTFKALTSAQVNQVAATRTRIFETDRPAQHVQATSNYLAGRSFSLRWDNGVTIDYRVDSADTLYWRRAGDANWQREIYRAYESAPDLIMFGHFMSGAPAHDCQIVVVDFVQAMATLLHGTMGTPYFGNEAAVETVFGVLDMDGVNAPKARRHHFSDEIVGRALTWNYMPGLTSMHLYTTPNSVSWIIFGEDGAGGLEWSGAGSYVKIREGIFLCYWLEEASGSPLGTFLVNMHTMHNCGMTYSCHEDALKLSPLGAHSRHTGQFDTRRFFNVGPEGRYVS